MKTVVQHDRSEEKGENAGTGAQRFKSEGGG